MGQVKLDELAALEAAARPGPWTADATDLSDVVVWGPGKDEWLANIGAWATSLREVGDAPAYAETDAADARLIAAARNALPALLEVARAATNYSPPQDHDWRCEIRTAAVGWKPGQPPVIQCDCGYDELRAALGKLETL